MSKAKVDPPKDAKGSRQSTLMGFFGKPKQGGPPPSQPSSSQAGPTTSSPTSTTLRTPSSVAGSSPTVASSQHKAGAPRRREESPLKRALSSAGSENVDDLSPPPLVSKPHAQVRSDPVQEDVVMEEVAVAGVNFLTSDDGSPISMGRRTKRKVAYTDPDSEDSDSAVIKPSTSRQNSNGRKPRKSLKEDSDSDEFLFDGDDADFAAAADDAEAAMASPSPSSTSASPAPRPQKAKSKAKPFVTPNTITQKSKSGSAPSTSTPSGPSRPPPRPLPMSNKDSDSRQSNSRGGLDDSNSFLLTASERNKIEAKETRREAEQCFDFLLAHNIRDREGKRPDDPEYDGRTIKIPASAWKNFSPFERQFWEIKQDHYDTVLFFQKGKFYELYEDDAMVGHQEFDLKLTDRVKMKMVGVPEQSFEFWAAKFLAAGHKVGKVEQAETAIGMEMRQKAGGKAKQSAGREIVNRELAQVFTNGTIVDGTYLKSDEANHCVAIKEIAVESTGKSSFGVCVLDASTGEFNISAFEDDILRTRLETMFRQIRPKELIHAKGNLSVPTQRLLRNILPSNTLWQSFRDVKEFYTPEATLKRLGKLFETDADPEHSGKPTLPDAIAQSLDQPLAMEALGGMLFYLESLHLDKDLVSQKNFNIYDPIKEGKNLILDGQTLGHMEVLVNNEGGDSGTLLELLQRCATPFGKRLFRIWLTSPLRDTTAINERLDAVDDLIRNPAFSQDFAKLSKGVPDVERLISRIHAGSIKQTDFDKVVQVSNATITRGWAIMVDDLTVMAESFESSSVAALLRSAPDLHTTISHVQSMYHVERTEKTMEILPNPNADADCDEADAEIERVVDELDDIRKRAKQQLKLQDKDIKYWDNGMGGKEIYQLQIPAKTRVPSNWTKSSATKAFERYYTPETIPVIRSLQEARETQSAAKKNFFKHLLVEFDKDRTEWSKMIKVIAELDCLLSLAKASSDLDEPKCRPEFIDSPQAFVDFEELRHPSMCLRADFIANNVQLGGGDENREPRPRTILLTGPNMAGKSTLLRMTAAGVIMAQLGCYVPAARARLSPVDKIQTRMGAYDNMFASASTFKVELDECSKILREAGPKSLVILDELGRGTSTYDGMAIAGAVLHHIATHTLPLAFFATHYGSLTDDFSYHPNVRKMHMQTHVDDARHQVIFLYKLIAGVAESSHGTHVARMAGVPLDVVLRADQVSAEFHQAFKVKMASRRSSALPVVAQADFAWLMRLAMGDVAGGVGNQMGIIRRAVGAYEAI